MTLRQTGRLIVYEAHANVGGSCLLRRELIEHGLRIRNRPSDGTVKLLSDGGLSEDVRRLGYWSAFSDHCRLRNIGHEVGEFRSAPGHITRRITRRSRGWGSPAGEIASRKAPTARGHCGRPSSSRRAASRRNTPGKPSPAWLLIARQPADAVAPIGNHTFRATDITAYLANGAALEHAQELAAHESPRATKFYDRTTGRRTHKEMERIMQ